MSYMNYNWKARFRVEKSEVLKMKAFAYRLTAATCEIG